MDYLAGIDLGSTSLKCVIYDLAGNVVASGTRPTERYNPYPDHPEWTVWQPEQIWGGAAAAMKEAVAKLDDPRHIKAVAVTGMGMDGVPIDEQGNWLYPFISWHDPRTEAQLQWWEKKIGAENTFRIGGNTLWRFSTALRLLWMAEHEPGYPGSHGQMAADRRFSKLHVVRTPGDRLYHGLLHTLVRSTQTRLVGGNPVPGRHRAPIVVRCISQRHVAG